MKVYVPGGAQSAQTASAGQIAAIYGLRGIRVGDSLGVPPSRGVAAAIPATNARGRRRTLEHGDKPRLRAALTELAEQDPLINVRQDDEREEISVSLYGEVQREVIEATLEREYGVRASFRDITVIDIERPVTNGI